MSIEDADTLLPKYWVYHPGEGAEQWDDCQNGGQMLLGWPELGNFRSYADKTEIDAALRKAYGKANMFNTRKAVWDMGNVIKPGDVVFACKGRNGILGRGIVRDGYRYDGHGRDGYLNGRPVEWAVLDPGQVSDEQWAEVRDRLYINKTLTDITDRHDLVTMLDDLFGVDPSDGMPSDIQYRAYGPEDFLSEVYMSEADFERVDALLRRKQNLILQGAPGVGKTFAAKRLAYALLGLEDSTRVEMVQFHQSYSYEDFIMGYRPAGDGFRLERGVFLPVLQEGRGGRRARLLLHHRRD